MIGVKNAASCHGKTLISEKCRDYKPVSEMVERFVQSLANANDSGTFDTSFEVKSIHPQRKRSKCLTELDRDSLMKFVKEFEERNKENSSGKQADELSPKRVKGPKIGDNVLEKQRTYENALIMASPIPYRVHRSHQRYSLSPLPVSKFSYGPVPIASVPEAYSTDSDFESTDQDFIEEEEEDDDLDTRSDSTTVYEKTPENYIKKIETERKVCRSARVLRFFSSARKKVKSFKSSSCNASPVPHRSNNTNFDCKPIQYSDTEDDDGISTGSRGSRNISPDSSFEMQPPIVPTFKVTPPSTFGNPAYELAKILRGSFHAKRASISHLRRSISDPDRYQIDDILQPDGDGHSEFVEAKSVVKVGLGAAMIKNLDVICSRALPSSTSPFRRWGQSSFRTPKNIESRNQLARRPSSLAASENDVYTKSMDDFNVDFNSQFCRSGELSGEPSTQKGTEKAGVTAWGTSFEKLLEDTAGIHTFAEFLKKEFSAENIYFWTACERYRRTESTSERAAQAMDIFSKHLANGAPEPVNVDSQARNTAEDNLQTADRNLFNQAQKQIFNLMKFDSYQRFIRSDLYKKCVEAGAKNQPLPFPGDKLDELLRTTPESPGPSKLKKSASNAEDRHRKSLLPWHRKTRCKSKDRADTDINSNKSTTKSQSNGNFLKLPTANSTSDIHSSRSSLSSFDATAVAAIGSGQEDAKAVSLCRVILCDGATTIVQTRPNETVRQLVERLLEKRGIHYQFFDVIISGNSKAIDLENPATMLAGKEVQIEQRVAFKLDLPDPKVISVKSKPKKALCDVLKPILHKYNYRLEDVQVFHRETHEQLDVTLPVTVADGQRLQVVMIKNEAILPEPVQHHKHKPNHNHTYQNQGCLQPPKNPSFPSKISKPITQQSTLDEITNKVFNELLQGKVESHTNQGLSTKPLDQCSLQSEDCTSESSSVFERFRRKDSNIPALKALRPKKIDLPNNKCSTIPSDDGVSLSTQNTSASDPTSNGIKKPLIAKWKTGVKLQVTGRAENHEEFLEGLKRAQRARLEDQRGTEINSELPDFLKDKENLSVANKLRKVRANLSPVGGIGSSSGSTINDDIMLNARNHFEIVNHVMERPQPAPRLSITKNNTSNGSISPMKVDLNGPEMLNQSNTTEGEFDLSCKGPPPLPPKPKILPIKPSNWGQNSSPSNLAPSKIPVDISRRHLATSDQNGRNVYLDQPSSSFV